MSYWPAALAFVALINFWTMLSFWRDKQRAVARERRIPEADLLGPALIGGSPGALIARQMFRHKTRKQPFSFLLYLTAMVQAGALLGFAFS